MADNRPPSRIYLNKQSMGAVTWGLVRSPGDLEYVHVPEGSTVVVLSAEERRVLFHIADEFEGSHLSHGESSLLYRLANRGNR